MRASSSQADGINVVTSILLGGRENGVSSSFWIVKNYGAVKWLVATGASGVYLWIPPLNIIALAVLGGNGYRVQDVRTWRWCSSVLWHKSVVNWSHFVRILNWDCERVEVQAGKDRAGIQAAFFIAIASSHFSECITRTRRYRFESQYQQRHNPLKSLFCQEDIEYHAIRDSGDLLKPDWLAGFQKGPRENNSKTGSQPERPCSTKRQ